MRVELNKKTGRFLVSVKPWEASLAKGIPSRRWVKTTRQWVAPVTRLNARYMIETFKAAEWSPEARAAAETAIAPKSRTSKGFPDWYKFTHKPFDKQMEALNHIYGLNEFALFMEMGTGKTKVVIDYCTAKHMEDEITSVLIIVPVTIRYNWLAELQEHCPEPYEAEILLPSREKRMEEFILDVNHRGKFRWLICGVESLSQGRAARWASAFVNTSECAVIVDESSRIKTHSAKRTKACIQYGLEGKFKGIMTGTPITQGILDLFAQFQFLDPDIIGAGDYWSFRNRYAIMGGYENRQVIGYDNTDELMDLVRPHVFQCTKDEALDLPDKIYQQRLVPMSAVQKKIYKDIRAGYAIINDIELEIKNILEMYLRLHCIVGGFYSEKTTDPLTGKRGKDDHGLFDKAENNPKIRELIALMEETQGNVIIWARYRWEIEEIAVTLRSIYGDDQVVEYHGGVSEEDRNERVKRFESKQCRFFVGNSTVGGIGINLISATTVVYYSNTFSLEDRLQSEDRAHRAGQTQHVTYIDLVMAESVDVTLLRAIRDKKDLADYVSARLRDRGEDAPLLDLL